MLALSPEQANQETGAAAVLDRRAQGASQVCWVHILGWGSASPTNATAGFYQELVCPNRSAVAGARRGFQRPVCDESVLDKLVLTFQ